MAHRLVATQMSNPHAVAATLSKAGKYPMKTLLVAVGRLEETTMGGNKEKKARVVP